jgi:acetyltransferase-like isoleucine patch superfamily enzyme
MRRVYRQLKALSSVFHQQVLKIRLQTLGENTQIERSVIFEFPDRTIIGGGSRISHHTIMRANGDHIRLGSDVCIQASCLLTANEGYIEIGSGSWLGAGSQIYGNGGVSIGSNVLIAAQTIINTVSHNFESLSTPINNQGINTNPVVIEDDVWVGLGARILQGVRIASGAIIGANSLVMRDVPSNAIVFGSPAKVRSFRTTNTSIKEQQS